ncbi:AAA family ATPase [Pelagibius sp. CAU 1746]|uniref:AAA family ATPase n=1 Tax=Pelagibius sp. CAU 1746 TaxID=3140370 RepID=UPI00325AEF78
MIAQEGCTQQDASAEVSAELTVTSFHASPVGGGILIGRGDAGCLRRAVIPGAALGRPPQPGERWRVTGFENAHEEFGPQICARLALPLLPSGKALIRYLATGRQFEGIGWATASRLWDIVGERLYDAIKRRDHALLAEVVGPQRAVAIVDGFGLLSEEVEVFQWLDRYGVSPRTAAAAASLWGRNAITRIQADPYELYLLEPWRSVDTRALRLGMGLTDRRRLLAAVEEALAGRFHLGHTAATRPQVEARLRALLGMAAAPLATRAIDLAIEVGRVLSRHDNLLQSRAAWFMEREIERSFAVRLARDVVGPSAGELAEAIGEVEAAEGYRLAPRQREAVHMAVSSPLSIISGGAGTGKTTTVKAILAASERRRHAMPPHQRKRFSYPQVALAGRAVKRIAEATGREAMTVARFLRELETGKRSLTHGLLIFDESSMLDVPSVYRVLAAVPQEVDLLFIGDPGQLPPIGPGLLFHRMVDSGVIPHVELDVIHRQSAATGIPAIAGAIRGGRLPDIPHFDPDRPTAPGVYLAPADTPAIGATTLAVFRALAGSPPPPLRTDALHSQDIQVLCPTKSGPAGSKVLNRAIEHHYMAHQPRIQDWGLSVGSKVIWLRNDYGKGPLKDANGRPMVDPKTGDPIHAGFMNGALGIVRRPTEHGAWLEFDDGAEDEVRAHDLERLFLGWAISIHKAQGSAFRRVVVPITKSRLLDRSLIYTAVTRAIETVVLVGDVDLLRSAVETAPKANARLTTLTFDHPD